MPGHDVNYQSWAGTLEPRAAGEEPVMARPPIADLAGGAYAALAICAAVVKQLRTGEGETIDVSMTDVLATWTGAVPPLTLPDGQQVGGRVPGYGMFATADGRWVGLGVISEDHLWKNLVGALGLDDAGSLSFPERLALAVPLNDRIAEAIVGSASETSSSPPWPGRVLRSRRSCHRPRCSTPRRSGRAEP